MLGCPIGLSVGSVTALVMGNERKTALRSFGGLLLGGLLLLYLPLTIMCAQADNDSWMPYKGDGDCWSEGGNMTGMNLGLAAGVIMGTGFGGLLSILWCGYSCGFRQDEEFVYVRQTVQGEPAPATTVESVELTNEQIV